jgi:hypothetical protein
MPLSPQFADLNKGLEQTLTTQIKNSVDEMLSMTAGHQIVSASEMADKLLDLRILVSQLEHQGEPHGDD